MHTLGAQATCTASMLSPATWSGQSRSKITSSPPARRCRPSVSNAVHSNCSTVYCAVLRLLIRIFLLQLASQTGGVPHGARSHITYAPQPSNLILTPPPHTRTHTRYTAEMLQVFPILSRTSPVVFKDTVIIGTMRQSFGGFAYWIGVDKATGDYRCALDPTIIYRYTYIYI